jgi:hypothetical protein
MHKLLDIKRSIIEIIPLAFATSSTMLSFLFTAYRDNIPRKINEKKIRKKDQLEPFTVYRNVLTRGDPHYASE